MGRNAIYKEFGKERTEKTVFEVSESYNLSGEGVGDVTGEVNDYVASVLEKNGFEVSNKKDEYGNGIADSHFDSEFYGMAIRLSGEDALSCKVDVLENAAGEKKWHAQASIYVTADDSGVHGEYDFDHEPTAEEVYKLLVKDNNIMDFDDFEKLILENCVHDERVTEVKGIEGFYEEIFSDLKKSLITPPAVSEKRCEKALDDFIVKVGAHDEDLAKKLQDIKDGKSDMREALSDVVISFEAEKNGRNNKDIHQEKETSRKRDGLEI